VRQTGGSPGIPDQRDRLHRFLDDGFKPAFIFCLLLALIPIWFFSYLPMVDLPLYADMARIFRDYPGPNGQWAGLIEVRWASPYMLTIALTGMLAKIFSVSVALKIVITLAVWGLPLSMWVLLRELNRERWWALAGFILAFGFPFFWGLIHYMLGLPLGVLFWATAFAASRTNAWKWFLATLALALLLLFTHLMLFAYFLGSMCVLSAWTGSPHPGSRKIALLCAVLVCAVPLMASGSQGLDTLWPPPMEMVRRLASVPGNMTSDAGLNRMPDFMLGALLLAGLIWSERANLEFRFAHFVPLGLVLVLVVFTPVRFGIHTLISERSAGLLVLAGLLLIGDLHGKPKRILRATLLLLVLAWIGIQVQRFHTFDTQAVKFDALLAKLESGKRAVTLVHIDAENQDETLPVQHFAGWYAAIKSGWSERSNLSLPHFPLHYWQVPQGEERWQLDDPVRSFSWNRYPDLKYLIVYSKLEAEARDWAGSRGKLIAHEGPWFCFERLP
jgi:hypothetical protein